MTKEEFSELYLQTFSDQQRRAVFETDGPVLLLAVPGGGKTTVLVTRLLYMILCCGVNPEEILTLTYTVAATRDMAERYRMLEERAVGAAGAGPEPWPGAPVPNAGTQQAGPAAVASSAGPEMMPGVAAPNADAIPAPEFRTINGICAKIINYYGRAIGKAPFRLLSDESELTRLISDIYRRVENDYATEADIRQVRADITYIKNMMLNADEIRRLSDNEEFNLAEIYQEYCRELRAMSAMDYDDQMTYALTMLRKSEGVRGHFQGMFRYICVDEAQDTSKIQHEIIKILSSANGNLFMVGDEDQSIYGFRAAYPEALLHFEADHPGAKVLLMEDNFRSGSGIVDAAGNYIEKNVFRHDKRMRAARGNRAAGCSGAMQTAGAAGYAGGAMQTADSAGYDSGAMQATGAAGYDARRLSPAPEVRVVALKGRGAQYTYLAKACAEPDTLTAVLYRDNESMIPLADLLERQGIPYRMRNAELSFFTSRTVVDIENIMRFAFEPWNADLFMQIYYKMSTYLSKENALHLCRERQSEQDSLLTAALRATWIPQRVKMSCRALRFNLERILVESGGDAMKRILQEMGYNEYLNRSKMSDRKVRILLMVARRESGVESFLKRMNDLQRILAEKEYDPKCRLVLSTIHSSKGLEYDRVYLLDAADGIFPESVPDKKLLRKVRRARWEAHAEARESGRAGAANLTEHSETVNDVLRHMAEGSSFGSSETMDVVSGDGMRGLSGSHRDLDVSAGRAQALEKNGNTRDGRTYAAERMAFLERKLTAEELDSLRIYEEERRLFYVAMTRAKEQLVIFRFAEKSTFADEVSEFVEKRAGEAAAQNEGKTGYSFGSGAAEASRVGGVTAGAGAFDSGTAVDRAAGAGTMRAKKKALTPDPYEDMYKPGGISFQRFCDSLGPGVQVEHQTFGLGVVTEVKGRFVKIMFGEQEKKLLIETVYMRGVLQVL